MLESLDTAEGTNMPALAPVRAEACWMIWRRANTASVIQRQWRLPEAAWAVSGAVLLIAGGLLTPSAAARAIIKGHDVYPFFGGMMLLAQP